MAFIKKYQEIDINTQTKDQVIHFFAFFVFSSSQAESIYIIQAHIKAITAITATYFIISATSFHINQTEASVFHQLHQGNQVHSIVGQFAAKVLLATTKKVKVEREIDFI